VLAQPDGEFELVSNALPVRVRVNGAWRAISTSLRRTRDGSWSAPLTSAPVTFSGGGSGPLVTVTDPASGRQVSVSWPYPLPSPLVSGDVALYPNVLPGVDLRLQATATGYQEVLVVHSAAAAADPRLRSLTFTLQGGSGVVIRDNADGTVTAVDSATGKTLFTSGQPMMWDSAPGRHLAAAATAASAGNGEVYSVPARRTVGTAAGRAALTLTPFAFNGADQIRYPLFIDPQINDTSTQYYAEVANFGGKWNTTTGTTSVGSGVVEVGDCGYSSCAYDGNGTTYYGYVVRTYFRMDTAPLEERDSEYAKVYSATFSPHEVGNSDGCTAQSVAAYESGAIDSSTSWGGPAGSEISTASSAAGGGSGCGAANVDLDVTSYLQAYENDGPANLTFELRAPDEGDELQYKTFTDNPTLTVWYNFAPLTPGNLSVGDAVTCTSTTYTSQGTPVLSAQGVDANPSPLNLDYTFNLVDTTTGSTVKNYKWTNGGGGFPSGNEVWWTSLAVTSGHSYEYDVQTNNVLPSGDHASSLASPVSGKYDFTVLSVAPASAPSISSFDYPSGQWGQPAGAPGIFTVGTGGNPDIAGFAYSFDEGAGSEPVPDTSDCGYLNDGGLGTSVSISTAGVMSANTSGELALVRGSQAQIMVPTTLTPGQHTLYVRAFDDAHNASPEAAYTFYVAPNYQPQAPPVDGSSLVSSASGANKTLVVPQSDCCGMTWPSGGQLRFAGTASGQTFTVPFTVQSAGTWQLGAEMTLSSNYGYVRVDLDQSTSDINLGGTATTPFDGYSATVSGSYLDLGTQTLGAGPHTLTFTITGKNASSSGYELGLVYFTLSPTNRYEADTLTLPGATSPSWTGTNTPSSTTLQQQCLNQDSWEDHCELLFTNATVPSPPATPPGSFTLTFDAPVESDYALGVNLGLSFNFGELEFELDPSNSDIILDNSQSQPINTYSPSISSRYVFLGGIHLAAGPHVLKVSVVSTTTGSSYNAGVNFLEAVPVTGATDANFTSAMNNLGIVSDGGTVTGYDFDLTGGTTGNNLSLQALQAAGVQPGTESGPGNTFSLNGASFTMPALRASGSTVLADNVIPDGQTIPLPTVDATGVALLVTSTCGTSPAAYATISYWNNAGGQAGQPSSGTIPAVGDWLSGPSSSAVMLLSHRDHGSTVANDAEPRLYEVMLPANPGYPLKSITLPVMPVNFLSGGCVEPDVLHILAIGTRTVDSPGAGSVWTGAYEAPMDVSAAEGQPMGGQTLREVVPLATDGSGDVRIRLSNAYTNTPVTFDDVEIDGQSSGGGAGTLGSPVQLKFGSPAGDSVTLPAGGDAWSDPAQLPPMPSSGELTVSMHISSSDTVAGPIHETRNLVTYYAAGDDTTNTGSDFSSVNSLAGQYYLSAVDVSDASTTDGTIAVLGDQSATQAPAGTYGNWAAGLPSALSADGLAEPGAVVDAATDDGIPTDWWPMNGTGLDTSGTAYDTGQHPASDLSLEGSPSWSTDNPGNGTSSGSMSLNGTSQWAQSAGPLVTTTSSFAVSAWVKLSSLPGKNAAIVAEDGSTDSAFYLAYDYGAGGKWGFYFVNSDTTNPTFAGAYLPSAVAGVWTHLTGVYNASAGDIQLYVNGALAASAAFNPSWSGNGPLTVGRSLYNGTNHDFFPGNISDVRVYDQTTMWPDNVSEIYDDTGTSRITTANAETAFENYAAVEPNLRDVIISLGANDVLQGESATTIEDNLNALTSDIHDRFISNQPGAHVQAFLTTIPPLGLSSSDPREAVREAVNGWIMAATGQDECPSGGCSTVTNVASSVLSADLGCAVAVVGEPDTVNPSLLSSGVPNSGYYQALAQAFADALENSGGGIPGLGVGL
jgi:hypothetical protein